MSFSAVQLCNLALSRIGVSQFVASFTESGTKAQLCNLHFDACRDAVLEAYPWPFATITADLALVTTAPSMDWGYAFRLPSDCLKPLRTLDAGRGLSSPFAISADSAGQLLLLDAAACSLQYTQRVEDPGRFPPAFGHALAWRLAMEFAPPLSVNSGLTQRAEIGYRTAIGEAEMLAINQGWPDAQPVSSIESARA